MMLRKVKVNFNQEFFVDPNLTEVEIVSELMTNFQENGASSVEIKFLEVSEAIAEITLVSPEMKDKVWFAYPPNF